jgi:hypothetical protein
MPSERPEFVALTLCDRAYAFLARGEAVAEAVLLAYVYGGAPPTALHARLAEPLRADPRFFRRPDGQWALVGQATHVPGGNDIRELAFTALALAATGPSPTRGRVVHVAALHVCGERTIERFSATVNPGKRVPRYVAERIGLAAEMLDDLPPFASIFDDLVRFLAARPIVAQDARLTWGFIDAEARRLGHVLADRVLIDANELATHVLELRGKPTLALVAAHLDIGMHRSPRPDEEVRVLGLVTGRLLALAAERDVPGLAAVFEARPSDSRAALRSGQVLKALTETPGIYVLRDSDQTPLYVGKARRLRSRVAAYVHRPLGTTRRLEGLVSAVQSVHSVECPTDLEALILEDREIRRLQPRFNTVRQQRAPRVWIRLPPTPAPRPGKHPRATARLELSRGPTQAEGQFVGPFRNESLAEQARLLARRVFGLDALRRDEPAAYAAQLAEAWRFLNGHTDAAIAAAQRGPAALLRKVLDFDWSAAVLPADPRVARYAVLRPTSSGIEGFLLDHGILRSWVMESFEDAPTELAAKLLADAAPRTNPEDRDVVLRWFGAQRPPACLILVQDDPRAAADLLQDAALALGERLQDTALSPGDRLAET